jgi:hypothetical protein
VVQRLLAVPCPLTTICVSVIDATDRISISVFSPAAPARRN